MTQEANGTGAESQESASETVNAEQQEAQPQEAQTEQKPEAQEKEKPDPEVKKVVPLAALHEERRARQELQRQLAEQAEMIKKANERLEALYNPPKQPPSKDSDPVGYIDHSLEEVKQAQRQMLERDQQREQQTQQQRVMHQLASRVQNAEAAFRQANPDYSDAIEHLDQVRARELQVFGASPDQIMHRIAEEKAQAAFQWATQGLNPAETAYNLARARGYTPKAQQQQSAEEKVDAQVKGTSAAKSLGTGGGAGAGKLTAQALANMSPEEFSKLTDAQFRQAMGG